MSWLKSKTSDRPWAIGRWDIPDYRDPNAIYLKRWYLSTPWFGIKLHHILLDDGDRALHDHPWNFRTFILKGGYIEQVMPRPKIKWFLIRRPGTTTAKKATELHRIAELPKGSAWTLVFNGPTIRTWGFSDNGTWVPYDEYLAQRNGA